MGASGCGKCTLLRIPGGLECRSSGELDSNGQPRDGPGAGADRAMVFQHYSPYPWLTVMENITFSRKLLAKRGDMQQRVAIARALMSRPAILLMDEPSGALDARTREVVHDLMLHVHRTEKTSFVFVTHDVEEAIDLGQGVVQIAARRRDRAHRRSRGQA